MSQAMVSTLTVLAVFGVMLVGFGLLVWLGFRAARKGGPKWPEER